MGETEAETHFRHGFPLFLIIYYLWPNFETFFKRFWKLVHTFMIDSLIFRTMNGNGSDKSSKCSLFSILLYFLFLLPLLCGLGLVELKIFLWCFSFCLSRRGHMTHTDSSSIMAAESKKSGLSSALSRLFLDGGWNPNLSISEES